MHDIRICIHHLLVNKSVNQEHRTTHPIASIIFYAKMSNSVAKTEIQVWTRGMALDLTRCK